MDNLRVLIGTPVHESKDYAMDRWLASVSALDYPADLLLVDNSQNPDYTKKLEAYCQKYQIPHYKIVHVAIPEDAHLEERLALAREVIREEVLKGGYDYWYSLECDVIVPPDALSKLTGAIDDYWMISHGYPARTSPRDLNVEFGTALIKRIALGKQQFLNHTGEAWFKTGILKNGGKYLNIFGLISPILHLDK